LTHRRRQRTCRPSIHRIEKGRDRVGPPPSRMEPERFGEAGSAFAHGT
jgi:hypothetical protein